MATLDHLHLSPQGFLFDHHSGLSFSTNSTGAFLLDLVIRGWGRGELLDALLSGFEVEPEQAAADLDEFLGLLRQHRVLPRERKGAA